MEGKTPLMIAISEEKMNSAKILLNQLKDDTESLEEALTLALQKPSEKMTRIILESNHRSKITQEMINRIASKIDKNGNDLLHFLYSDQCK